MNKIDPADEAQLFATIDRWVEREVKPIVKEFDHADKWPAEIVEQMKELGLFGATVVAGVRRPRPAGHHLRPDRDEDLLGVDGDHRHLQLAPDAGAAIEKFGTEPQKRHWLPKFATGEVRGGLALTEPDAGTDLQAIRMTARRDGDDYVHQRHQDLDHQRHRGLLLRAAGEDQSRGEPRHTGMSLFIAPKGPGFTRGRKLEKLGYKSIDTGELIFEDYRIPADHLIGEVEGQGFTQVAGGLELGRINVAARGVGIAEGALKLATDYAQLRKTIGKPICEHQAIQLKLGEMATRARAARLLTLDAAQAFDRGERCDMEAGMAKWFATETALENATESMRIHGAYGYSKEYAIERLYRDAPLTCIGEGTNEMQRIIIARQWRQARRHEGQAPQGHSHPHARAVRRRSLRHHVPGGAGRRGDQGRGARGRSLAPGRALSSGQGRQRVFPGLEPRQEERDPRPQVERRPARSSRRW